MKICVSVVKIWKAHFLTEKCIIYINFFIKQYFKNILDKIISHWKQAEITLADLNATLKD